MQIQEARESNKYLQQDFSTSALPTFQCSEFFVVRGCPRHYRVFSSIPDLYSLKVSSSPFLSPVVKSKKVTQALPTVDGLGVGKQGGKKWPPFQNHSSIGKRKIKSLKMFLLTDFNKMSSILPCQKQYGKRKKPFSISLDLQVILLHVFNLNFVGKMRLADQVLHSHSCTLQAKMIC